MVRRFFPLAALMTGLGLLALIVAAGCNRSPDEPPRLNVAGEHVHATGQHGGVIVEIGRDNYHAEAIFEKDGVVRVYTLGKDESRVEEVESQTLIAYARAAAGGTAEQFELKPAPQPGDAEGKTSAFVGTLPRALWAKRVEVTAIGIRIRGDRYRFAFSTPEADDHDEPMPVKSDGDDERKLYLTAGGKYTEADIKANGYMTASQKFKGLKPAHDAEPKPGDKVCPISKTKASPKFTWVVGGKTYEFCCPPCVDEFVQKAKEKPNEVKDPADYVQRP